MMLSMVMLRMRLMARILMLTVDDEDEGGGDVGDDANVHEDGVDDVDVAHHHINISMYIIIEIRIIIISIIIISSIIITDRFRSK